MRVSSIWWIITVVLTSASASGPPVPQAALTDIETNLLSILGFKRKPRIDRSKILIPQAMLDLYRKQTGYILDTTSILKPGLHTKTANTVRTFAHVESPVDTRFAGYHKFRLKFNTSTIPLSENLKAAELTLSRELVDWISPTNEEDHFQRVLVNDIIKPGVKGKRDPIMRLVDSKVIDTRKGGSVSLDVLPAVERWLEGSTENHGLLIIIKSMGKRKTPTLRHIRLKRDTSESQDEWNSRQPLLFTYTDDGKVQDMTTSSQRIRSRRAMNKKHRRKESREMCKRHSMYVDFTEVGWNDWIVAPPGYDAFYCQGECNFPLADHLNTTNHAIVQTLVNSVSPTKVPKTCCVPTQLNSISMLYLDEENKVVLKNYKEMTVVGCGCR